MAIDTPSISIDYFLYQARQSLEKSFDMRRKQILSPLAEKAQIVEQPRFRGLCTVPFSEATLRLLATRMRIHESISRTISCSDVATFTVDDVYMYKPAQGNVLCPRHEHCKLTVILVYNCRTSNAWYVIWP